MRDPFAPNQQPKQVPAPDPAYGLWIDPLQVPLLADHEFDFFAKLIHDRAGIHMPRDKKGLMENRLGKRLLSLKIRKFSEYKAVLLRDKHCKELELFTNSLTTNKTEFYREKFHFQFLADVLKKQAENRMVTIWSAAASTGQEAYTTAMVCEEVMKDLTGFDYRILGTDIDTECVETAVEGIYDVGTLVDVPTTQQFEYFEATGRYRDTYVQIGPKLRERIKFRAHNLVDYTDKIPLEFDMIFLRNVLFYFDQTTTNKIVSKLVSQLKPGGLLFIGMTEKLQTMDPQLTYLQSSIYQKKT